jgi:hypothetical protein
MDSAKRQWVSGLAAAVATLIGLFVLAAISPKAMIVGSATVFAFLLARFVWLVVRELK